MEKSKKSFILLSLFLLILPGGIFSQSKSPKTKPSMAITNVDLLILGGTVVSMDRDHRVIEDGAIAVKGGEILAVGTRSEISKNYRGIKVINAAGKFVVPGLINTHTHIPMTLFRGIADDLDLQDWLTRYIFPSEAKNVDEAFVRAGTKLGLAELIRGGTTTYCDMYYFEDAIADETYKAGVRGVLGETIIDFPVADNKTNAEAMAYAEKFVRKWQGNRLIVPALAPHAPYTVSQDHLMAVRKLSDKLDAAIVMHLAEANTETDYIGQNHKGLRPIEYVEKIGFLNDKLIAAHVVQANEHELQILKMRGVGIAHNPQSNMKLAAGVAPVPMMLKMDIPVGLGTDGAASNNDLDLWEEMDTAAKLHKLYSGDPKALSAEQAFEMATIRGARALHLEKIIGSLEVGKRADIVIVDSDNLNQTPVYNIYSSLVYSTKSSDVNSVIIDGKPIMIGKRLLTLNENAIKETANLYREKIIKSLTKP